MEQTNRQTHGTHGVQVHTHGGATLHGTAHGYTAHGAHAARAVRRRKDGELARRPLLLTAAAAALEAVNSTAVNAYRTQGANGGALAAISAAVANGDIAAYRELSRRFGGSVNAEEGLNAVRRAVKSAKATAKRYTDAGASAEEITAAVYNALCADGSGSAVDMFGEAFAAVYERRGHNGAALFYGSEYRAACNAAHRVLYAARTQTARAAACVEDWTRGDLADVATVPSGWDVYTFDELEYLRRERDAIAAAAGNRYAARYITYRLRGLTAAQIADRLGVTVRTVERAAAAAREAFNRLHGTAYGAAHARAREQ